MMLLLTVWVVPVDPATRIPRKPVVVPVPPLLIVIDPIRLFETFNVGVKLKSRIPMIGLVLAVTEVALITMVEEPSRLPMKFGVIFPMLAGASAAAEPLMMPMNADRSAPADVSALRAVVWLMPEMVLPWMLLNVVVLELVKEIPRNSFVEPVIVVTPDPSAAPNPITFPVIVCVEPTVFDPATAIPE